MRILLIILFAASALAVEPILQLRTLSGPRDTNSVNNNFRAQASSIQDQANRIAVLEGVSAEVTLAGDNAFTGNNTFTTATITVTCQTGFTKVTAQSRFLWCMQTAEEGTATAFVAQDNCFTTYGGRLPTRQEWWLTMNNFSLTDETDDWEWTGDWAASAGAVVGNGGLNNAVSAAWTGSDTYRCLIPVASMISN